MIKRAEIKLVFFDYGGVLAEEGFTKGLMAIAVKNGLDEDSFFHQVTEIIYECGYVLGKGEAADFWHLVRQRTGISGADDQLSHEILDRFILRSQMLAAVGNLRRNGIRTAILSDQTNWLDILEARDNFFHNFETVINSFHAGKSKRDPTCFTDAAAIVGLTPEDILFVDDNAGHIARATKLGMHTHYFQGMSPFLADIATLAPAGG